jgi:hypothetical protein
MGKQFAQHRLLCKQFDHVLCGVTTQQFDNFQTGLNFAVQQSGCATV